MGDTRTGGGTSGGADAPLSPEAQAAQSKLEAMSPIYEPPDSGPGVTATVHLTWYVVFMPEQPAEGGSK